MVHAYCPHFGYDPNGLTAHQLMVRWWTEKRFLPVSCREPSQAAQFVAELIAAQMEQDILAPRCVVHGHDMLLLGTTGSHWAKITRKLKIREIVGVGKRGFEVHNGIFRCPTPGCVMVASPEDENLHPSRCNKVV
jgi:hypothetical protein